MFGLVLLFFVKKNTILATKGREWYFKYLAQTVQYSYIELSISTKKIFHTVKKTFSFLFIGFAFGGKVFGLLDFFH
jgi:hypothetical protein